MTIGIGQKQRHISVEGGIFMEEMSVLEAGPGTYRVKRIDTDDEDMKTFLFRLGCYSGEEITVVSSKKKSCVVVIKDGRYSLDELLAYNIIV